MEAELQKLSWFDRIDYKNIFHHGVFYQSIVFNALYRRQAKFNGDFVFHYTSVDVFKKLIIHLDGLAGIRCPSCQRLW